MRPVRIGGLVFLLIGFISAGAFAEASEAPERPAPTLSVTDAIKLADTYVQKEKIDTSKHLLVSVTYHDVGGWTQSYIGKGPYWQITYELKTRADGGQIFIFVYMNGSVGKTGGLDDLRP